MGAVNKSTRLRDLSIVPLRASWESSSDKTCSCTRRSRYKGFHNPAPNYAPHEQWINVVWTTSRNRVILMSGFSNPLASRSEICAAYPTSSAPAARAGGSVQCLLPHPQNSHAGRFTFRFVAVPRQGQANSSMVLWMGQPLAA